MTEKQIQKAVSSEAYTIANPIEPFNDIWYLDCLMHGVAQIANFYNILPCLFENDYFKYEFACSNHYPTLSLKTKHFIPWTRIFDENGISVSMEESDDHCLITVKEAIDHGSHVMLPVDCYYEDIRPDAFQKWHVAHYIVIYGYDDSTQEFLILEHNYENDLRYKQRRIKYSTALYAHFAFPSLKNQNIVCHIIFSKKNNQDKLLATSKENISKGIEFFVNSLPDLYRFCDEFYKFDIPSNDKEKLLEYINYYHRMFQTIYAAKKYQVYFYEYLLTKRSLNAFKSFSDAGSCSDWSIIMGMFCRCVYKKDVPEDFNKIVSKFLNHIVENERRWRDLLTYA